MCHNCSNKCSDLSYIVLPFWFQDFLGPMFSGFKVYWFWVFWVLGFWGIMFL